MDSRGAEIIMPDTDMAERLNRASANIWAGSRKAPPPTTAAFSTMPNAMPYLTSSSPTTTASVGDASTNRHPPNSSLNFWDTTQVENETAERGGRRLEKPGCRLARGAHLLEGFGRDKDRGL